jgi:hypothetical protein
LQSLFGQLNAQRVFVDHFEEPSASLLLTSKAHAMTRRERASGLVGLSERFAFIGVHRRTRISSMKWSKSGPTSCGPGLASGCP